MYELVPIVSWLVQHGKCRSCDSAIDHRHLAVELACAVAGASAFLLWSPAPAAAWAILCWLAVPLILLDLEHYWLPDRLTAAIAVSGFALGGLVNGLPLVERTFSAILSGAGLWTVGWLWGRVRGMQALGSGDPKLLAALTLWTSWQGLPMLLVLSAGLGIIWAVGKARNATPDVMTLVPFGAMMAAATPFVVVAQARLSSAV